MFFEPSIKAELKILVQESDAHGAGALQRCHVVNGSVERLIAFFFPFFHSSDVVGLRFFGWASLELASEAGLFRPDILTDHC